MGIQPHKALTREVLLYKQQERLSLLLTPPIPTCGSTVPSQFPRSRWYWYNLPAAFLCARCPSLADGLTHPRGFNRKKGALARYVLF